MLKKIIVFLAMSFIIICTLMGGTYLYVKNNIYDEFIEPSLIEGASFVEQGDGVIWFNYRPDRAIQILTYVEKITNHIVTMMPVSDNIKAPYAYKIDKLNNTMGEYLSKNNKKQ